MVGGGEKPFTHTHLGLVPKVGQRLLHASSAPHLLRLVPRALRDPRVRHLSAPRPGDERGPQVVETQEQKIDDRILGAIRRSRFVVVDMTGQRASVYFEAGSAEGLGVPVIWTCRAGEEKNLAFDTRQNGHLIWEMPEQLRSDLTARIERRGWRLRG